MDSTTEAVRQLYEEFPYPSGPPVMRVGFDARLTMSHGRLRRPGHKPIRVLDAGCGRGLGLLAAASLQPDVQFLGIDLNRVALEEVQGEVRARGLTNVRTQPVDLMSLEGLQAPPNGFDVIHSSGVVHHLVDPILGLRNLAGVLAPHGVLQLMVYSKAGRAQIHPIARAIELVTNAEEPLAVRLETARALVQTIASRHDIEGWTKAAGLDDTEFVDRYLHPQETSYDVTSLWNLIEAAGLKFLAWTQPKDWKVEDEFPPGPFLEHVQALGIRERFQLMYEIRSGGQLDAFLCHRENGAREILSPEEVARSAFAVHPEGTFKLSTRNLWNQTRIESIAWCTRNEDPRHMPNGPLSCAALILRTQDQPFLGLTLLEAMAQEGIDPDLARSTIVELERSRILYRPHESELETDLKPSSVHGLRPGALTDR